MTFCHILTVNIFLNLQIWGYRTNVSHVALLLIRLWISLLLKIIYWSVFLLLNNGFNNSYENIFLFFVVSACRALHTLLHAVHMHYSESNDWIDVVLLVQEMAFLYNPCAPFEKCKMMNFKTNEYQSSLSWLKLKYLSSKIFNDSFHNWKSYKVLQ